MGRTPELVFFERGATAEVVAHMDQLFADRSGWIVVDPEVVESDLAHAPRTGGLFSARGPVAPELSWVPPQPGRKGLAPVAIGVRHATGPKVVDRLARYDHPVPDSWDVVDDSPKRGLVASLPDDADRGEVLDWLLRTGEALTAVELTGQWRASVHTYV